MKPFGNLVQKLGARKSICLLGLLFFVSLPSRSQYLMEDKPALDSMRHAIDHLYNFQFERSTQSLARFKARYGQHPGYLLYQAVFSFWKHFPISSRPKEFSAYMKNLENVVVAGEALEKKSPENPEPSYYVMTALLMLARHHSEEGEYIKAVNATRKAYGYIRKGFEWKAKVPEFYFSSGLFNYYRVAFPEAHPVYSPFTVFFPAGDKDKGLKELEIASQKSVFSRAEALGFLTMIQLRDNLNYPQALRFAQQLSDKHPANWLYWILYAETLLENQKTDPSEGLIAKLLGRSEPTALQAGYYLKGRLEQLQSNPDGAKWAFQKSLLYLKSKDRLSKGYASLAYNELGKISIQEGNREWARKYFNLAAENSSYKKVKEDRKAAGF